jgi:hypothetical protein
MNLRDGFGRSRTDCSLVLSQLKHETNLARYTSLLHGTRAIVSAVQTGREGEDTSNCAAID